MTRPRMLRCPPNGRAATNTTTPPLTCILCGWVFSRQKGVRRMKLSDLRARVKQQWLPGPVVYARVFDPLVSEDRLKEPVVCCHTCLKRPGDLKAMLPMDSFLLYLFAPAVHPDQRRHKRMQLALSRTHNGVSNPYRLPIASMQQPVESATHNELVLAWWRRNLQTPCFRHKHTARAVRIALRTTD